MPRQTAPFFAFNRGEVSDQALARVDVEKLRLAGNVVENWCPRTIGSMMFRPGLGYIGGIRADLPAKIIPFHYASTDTAIVELTDATLRVFVNDAVIARPAVTSTLQAFSSWTLSASSGSSVAVSAGKLSFANVLDKSSSQATGALTVSAGQEGIEHALRIVVDKGPVNLRIGTAFGLEDVFLTTTLGVGAHSIAFTPGVATVYVQLESGAYAARVVSSVALEAAGAMALPSPYLTADLPLVRYTQSADVVFLACKGKRQYKVERRSARSWSLVLYQANDGPFGATSPATTVNIKPSACIGDVTLTASQAYFKSTQIGSLIRMYHQGQFTTRSLIKANTYTDLIRISGVSKVVINPTTYQNTNDRSIVVTLSGAWAGTVVLYRSTESATSGFTQFKVYNANVSETVSDFLDNTICWYKLGVYGSGDLLGICQASISYGGGGGAGVARITAIASPTSASAEVLAPFKNVTTALDFRMSQWSDADGWPSSVTLHEGRLWFAGASKVWGSVSDNYLSFDLDKEGDAGPIQRTIGEGPIANINWLLPLGRLQLGADSAIPSARSSTFDEPLTPTVFMLKNQITMGAAPIAAVKIDSRGQFVDQSKLRAYDLKYDVQANDYTIEDVTRLHPLIAGDPRTGVAGFVALAAQRIPDTRVHYVRADGQVCVLLYDAVDSVAAWWRIKTDGVIEDVCTLPGQPEDRVYYVVKRTINGQTKRSLERLAMLHECVGGTLSKNLDAFATYQGAPTATLTGLDYLEGKRVQVWADGKDAALVDGVAGYTVSGGSITLAHNVANAVVGLPYSAPLPIGQTRLRGAPGRGGQSAEDGRPRRLFAARHPLPRPQIRPGRGHLDDLPQVEDFAVQDPHTVYAKYDEVEIPFDGENDTDPRFWLVAQSPRPVTVLGATVNLVTQG
jgi:hypothetical protein